MDQPKWAALGFAACILCFVSLASPACAMIDNTEFDISSENHFTLLWSFEFAPGGQLNMSLRLDEMDTSFVNNSVQILLCTDDQLDGMKDATLDQVCAPRVFDFVECVWQTQLGDGFGAVREAHLSLTAPHTSWYRLLQLNCRSSWYKVNADYVAVNPGGEYLSLSEVPYKQVFLVTSIAWSLLGGLWVFNWSRYYAFNIRLQMLMTSVPVTEAILSLVNLALWREMSTTGLVPEGLSRLSFTCISLVRFCFWGCLLAAASGWRITRSSVSCAEQIQGVVMSAGLVVLWVAYSTFGGFMLFFVMMQYLLILRVFFTSIVFNREHIIHQLNLIRNMDFNVQLTPAWTKNIMFTKLQSGVTSFVSCQLIFTLWAVVFLRDSPWVAAALENTMDGVLAIFVGWYFRLRPFRPYFEGLMVPEERARRLQGGNGNGAVVPVRVNINADGQPDVPLIQDDDFLDGVGGAMADRQVADDVSELAGEWRPGMPIPACVLNHHVEDQNAPLLVVEFPRSSETPSAVAGTVAALPQSQGGARSENSSSYFMAIARPLRRSGADGPSRVGDNGDDRGPGIQLRPLQRARSSSDSQRSNAEDSEEQLGSTSGNGYARLNVVDDTDSVV